MEEIIKSNIEYNEIIRFYNSFQIQNIIPIIKILDIYLIKDLRNIVIEYITNIAIWELMDINNKLTNIYIKLEKRFQIRIMKEIIQLLDIYLEKTIRDVVIEYYNVTSYDIECINEFFTNCK